MAGPVRTQYIIPINPPIMKSPAYPRCLQVLYRAALLPLTGSRFCELGACPACGGPSRATIPNRGSLPLFRDRGGGAAGPCHGQTVCLPGLRQDLQCGRAVLPGDTDRFPGNRISALRSQKTMPANRTAAYLDAWASNREPEQLPALHRRTMPARSPQTTSLGLACRSRLSHSLPLQSGPARGLPSKGQKFSRPVVSHPQTGQRFTGRRERTGQREEQKRKKNGTCRYQSTTVTAIDPASRQALSFHGSVLPPLADRVRGQGIGRRPECCVKIRPAAFPRKDRSTDTGYDN